MRIGDEGSARRNIGGFGARLFTKKKIRLGVRKGDRMEKVEGQLLEGSTRAAVMEEQER